MSILWVILPPILFNLWGLIDTFLTKELATKQHDWDLHNATWTLMIIGGFIALVVAIILGIIFVQDIQFTMHSLILLLAGILNWIAAFPYFKALQHEKVENIVPVLQSIPIFVYVFWVVFLDEYLSWIKILLMLAIVICTLFFSRDHESKKFNTKWLYFTLLSVVCYALSFVVFKLWWKIADNIWVALFWQHLGIFLATSYRFLQKKTVLSTIKYLKKQGAIFAILNICNELFFIIGYVVLSILFLYHPVVVVDTLSNGIQPLLLFGMVYLSYKIFPHIFERKYNKNIIIQKIFLCCVLIILLGFFSFL